jgi:hypothetical protein
MSCVDLLFLNFLQVDAVLRASQTFFELPENCKDLYRRNSTQYEGYSGIDQEM